MLGFLTFKTDVSLFFYHDSSLVFLLIYVDNILILNPDLTSILIVIHSL